MTGKMSPAMKRYQQRLWPTLIVYAAILIGVIRLFDANPPTGPIKYAAAIVPAFPILGVIALYARYVYEETDEFRRLQVILTILCGLALVLGATTVWGFLEVLAGAPHIPLYFVAPLFCVGQGLSVPFVAWKYR